MLHFKALYCACLKRPARTFVSYGHLHCIQTMHVKVFCTLILQTGDSEDI